MKKHLFIFSILLIFFLQFFVAPIALADCECICEDNTKTAPVLDRTYCLKLCGSALFDTVNGVCKTITANPDSTSISLKDPLNLSSPEDLYVRVINGLLGFVGVAALVIFIYAGFIFLFSAGNAEKTKKAKDTMLYAVIGVLVAMASYAILDFIFQTLQTSTGNK